MFLLPGRIAGCPGRPLHTNFKLNNAGEYLALTRPDGTNIACEFAPVFPPQLTDISYGTVREAARIVLLDAGAEARAFVPTNSSLGASWTTIEFNDAAWANGATGIGYDRQTLGVNYLPFLGLNIESAMYNINQTVYARLPFTLENPADITGLTLRMQFEDGFIAYLNGVEVARSNAPANAAWNSGALGPRSDTVATNYLDFDISESSGFLQAGANVLAFQALNNPVASPDLLLVPQLVASEGYGLLRRCYFLKPTPGKPNSDGVDAVGPLITDVAHLPAQPADRDSIAVSAHLHAAFAPIASVALYYRVMFGNETQVVMYDDGSHGDGAAHDSIYGASIPASAANAGQMVRWYIKATDTTGTNISRFPTYTRTNDSPAYLGTVIVNPALTNPLPVFHWFVQNPPAADTTSGTRCSVYYGGEFYDNVFCRVRGASAPTYPRKPYKFDFNPGDHFRLFPDQPRRDELNLNATYQDKAYVRAPLTFETYRNAGVPACEAFNARVQQNGVFYSVAVMIEQVDEEFFETRGLPIDGALYKMFNGIDSATSGVEKKTRRTEDNSDLQQLVNGVSRSNPNRAKAIFDLLDLPEVVNYIASGIVAQDWDRSVKNIYLYRDTTGTGLWQMYPWDKDLTFGKVGLVNDGVTATRDLGPDASGGEPYISHPYYGSFERNCCGMNQLMDAVYKTPAAREMYMRRLRTLMDELLQAPETPANQLKYEQRLDQLYAEIKNDAPLDLAKWGAGYGQAQTLATAMAALRTNYFIPRRTHLYNSHSVDSVGRYAEAVGIPHAQAGSPPLQFGAIEYNPASSNQAQEYVELLNTNLTAVDISGWKLGGGVTFTFAPGTVVPAQSRVYVSPNVAAFRTRTAGPRAGQGLFVVGNYSGQLSARGETLRLADAAGAGVTTNSYAGNPSAAQQYLRITELMYHPAALAGNTNSPDEFEYIELRNISSSVTLDLRGVRLVNGVEFGFTGSARTTLAPGARVLVVKNLAVFTARYGNRTDVAGQYAGSLDNSGERIQLLDAGNEEILDFSYNNQWYPITDGFGFSLVAVNEAAEPDTWGDPASWRASGTLDGSPGAADPAPSLIPPVVINEVLSRTDFPPPADFVELFNPTANPVDISGWFISDDAGTPKKFCVPSDTVIPAGGFAVFTETNFNSYPGLPSCFAFSSKGDEAFLFSADAQGNLTGYLHGFKFGAADDEVSFGRYVNSLGEEHFVAQNTLTPGATNTGPRIGPAVISEIMYHPFSLDATERARFEFVEVQNVTRNPVALYDPAFPTNTWRLRGGVDFDFPANTVLDAGAVLLVVGFDPLLDAPSLDSFRAAYNLAANVVILGPWSGALDNAGERIELERPAAPVAGEAPDILVEAVRYYPAAPWPAEADGAGASLQRLLASAFGNDPTNWRAALPTPGTGSPVVFPPPELAIDGSGVLSWPASDPDVILQSADRLAESAQWQEVLSPRVAEGGRLKVRITLDSGSRFYRLIRP